MNGPYQFRIVIGNHFEKRQGTDNFSMQVIGVKHPEEGLMLPKNACRGRSINRAMRRL